MKEWDIRDLLEDAQHAAAYPDVRPISYRLVNALIVAVRTAWDQGYERGFEDGKLPSYNPINPYPWDDWKENAQI